MDLQTDPSYFKLSLGRWELNGCRNQEILSQEIVGQATSLIKKWSRVYKYEPVLAQKEFGVPSFVVRIDATTDSDGKLYPYEIEGRPAGMGLCHQINRQFAFLFTELTNSWPEVVVVRPSDRINSQDDELWASEVIDGIPPRWYFSGEKVCLTRNGVGNYYQLLHLLDKSISLVITEGNKSYGEKLGLWKKVTSNKRSEHFWEKLIDWEKNFVVKPLDGTGCTDVLVWDVQSRPGSVRTKDEVIHTINRYGKMYLQEFVPPIKTNRKSYPYIILRIFFVYNLENESWDCVGGAWLGRNNLIIHGATDATVGPLIIEN